MMCPPFCFLSVASSFAIPIEKRRIPGNLIERCRCHELLQPIDPAYVGVSRDGRPDGSKGLVGDAAEKEELDVVEFPKHVVGALVIEESMRPGHWRLDDAVERDETRNQRFLMASAPGRSIVGRYRSILMG
jgi:hypothetical protein